jgi:hypothetical protein
MSRVDDDDDDDDDADDDTGRLCQLTFPVYSLGATDEKGRSLLWHAAHSEQQCRSPI